MRYLIIFIGFICSLTSFGQPFFEKADQFFREYVKDGLVKYDEIYEDRSDLDLLVREIGRYSLLDVSPQEKKAFYINAYNILVIKHIIAHFPAEGPMAIPGFFDQLKSQVAGEYLTLDQIEKERLFSYFQDPRLHFTLVCAANGCPPLAAFSYKPDLIENQIAERTEFVLNFQSFIRVNNTSVEVSKIFEWYKEDFVNESGSILKYIDKFHRENLKGKSLSFYEYEWKLNRY